jgi:hypothetical protein
MGAIILFDSGQMTCDNFKSRGLLSEELDAIAEIAVVDVVCDASFDNSKFNKLLDDFDFAFMLDEDDEDFSVAGFAGTKINIRKLVNLSNS